MESILEPAIENKAGVELQIIPTADESHTLFSPLYNETYHSKHGAVQESRHVYVEYGLKPLLEQKSEINIFEMGFGTGLNAMVTIEAILSSDAFINYHGLEKHPVDEQIIDQLNYTDQWDDQETKTIFKRLHHLPWNESIALHPNFYVKKIKEDIFNFSPLPSFYDLIFHDAFAPACQPEMWEAQIIEKFYKMLKPRGILVTYSAKGQFKRDLKAAGFSVESLPGPIGKREMTRATKV